MVTASLLAFWLPLLLSAFLGAFSANPPPPVSNSIVGSQFTYTVQHGDSLTSVGARFGVNAAALAALNSLKPGTRLKPGQKLQIDNRHIVLRTVEDGIVINIPQRMLFYFQSGKVVAAYPVGLGRRSWPTPRGTFRVIEKETDKTWIVPESIQEEMIDEGKPLRTRVPPGPDNPLGKHWIRISANCGIHGTNAPSSIYHFQTHGCIRLKPEDIASLFEMVPIGMPVEIVYEPVLLARLPNGKLYLEIHEDIYGKADRSLDAVKAMSAASGFESMLDWHNVIEVLKERRGLAQEVGLPAANIVKRNP